MREVIGRPSAPLLLLCLATAIPCAVLAGDSVPTAIPTLPDYELSKVRQINNRGDIAGQAVRLTYEPTEQALVWRKQRRHGFRTEVLPPLDGLLRGDARGFATDDLPIGFSYTPGGGKRAVAWATDAAADQIVPIELEPPAGFTDAQALSGNGSGEIVGEATNPGELINGLQVRHAVLWRAGRHGSFSVCDLGVPDGYYTSTANDVGRSGVVVGTARGPGSDGRLVSDVFVWRPRSSNCSDPCQYEIVRLPSDPALPNNQSPAINERGDVVARADTPAPATSRPLYWRRTGRDYADPEVLPVPEGFSDAFARSVNERGDIVGTVQQKSRPGGPVVQSSVVVWKRKCGDWEPVVLTSPSEVTILNAQSINDSGDVVADTSFAVAGSSGAYLWTNATSGAEEDGHDHGDCDEHSHDHGDCDGHSHDHGDCDGHSHDHGDCDGHSHDHGD
jgi:hypothetical protein